LIRAADWLLQARRDLMQAEHSAGSGFHEWACFASQQAGEKAAKALLSKLGFEAKGHSILELLKEAEAEVEVPGEVVEAARALDKHYIPSRYPNSYPSGAPFQYYSERDSRDTIAQAQKVISFAERLVA